MNIIKKLKMWWNPSKKPQKKTCWNCRYQDKYSDELPCDGCSSINGPTKWKAKK